MALPISGAATGPICPSAAHPTNGIPAKLALSAKQPQFAKLSPTAVATTKAEDLLTRATRTVLIELPITAASVPLFRRWDTTFQPDQMLTGILVPRGAEPEVCATNNLRLGGTLNLTKALLDFLARVSHLLKRQDADRDAFDRRRADYIYCW